MINPKVSTVLWMMFAWTLSMPVMAEMAEEVKRSPSPLVEMNVSPARIDWSPAVEAQSWVLTLSGPDELFLRREIKAGKALFLSIFDSEGDRLPDGSYTWALKAVSKSPRRQSGSFSIRDGSFVETPRGNGGSGGGASKPPLVPTIAQDSIETGNLIVQKNACIGDECGTTDANFSALKLKAVQPNILFDDVALPEGPASSHDWALFVNYNDVDQFSIVDFTNALFPFSIAAGAPNNSLFIASTGNVGIGTAVPGSKLDIEASIAGSESARITNLSSTGFSGFSYFDESTSLGLFIGLDNANNVTRINSVNNNPIVILTNSTERIRFPAPGGNYITAANGAALTAGGTWLNASTRESKRDIVELSDGDALKALRELTPVTFRYKEEPGEQYVGFVAEDVPDLVATNDRKHLSSMDVVAVLTRIVKDQQKTIDELSARLAALEGKEK